MKKFTFMKQIGTQSIISGKWKEALNQPENESKNFREPIRNLQTKFNNTASINRNFSNRNGLHELIKLLPNKL
jgi:hypothetical protein